MPDEKAWAKGLWSYVEVPEDELPPGLMDLRRRLESAWCRETAYEPAWERWRPDLPSIGQCYVTARVVVKYFGGAMIGTSRHTWNVLPDLRQVDLTADQFEDGRRVPDVPDTLNSYIHYPENRGSAWKRYLLLLRRLEAVP